MGNFFTAYTSQILVFILLVATATTSATVLFDSDVLELVVAKRDIRLRTDLEKYVHLVHFEPGRIEFRPAPGAPRNLAQELGQLPINSRFARCLSYLPWNEIMQLHVNENNITTLIRRIRKKIEPNASRPQYLVNGC